MYRCILYSLQKELWLGSRGRVGADAAAAAAADKSVKTPVTAGLVAGGFALVRAEGTSISASSPFAGAPCMTEACLPARTLLSPLASTPSPSACAAVTNSWHAGYALDHLINTDLARAATVGGYLCLGCAILFTRGSTCTQFKESVSGLSGA